MRRQRWTMAVLTRCSRTVNTKRHAIRSCWSTTCRHFSTHAKTTSAPSPSAHRPDTTSPATATTATSTHDPPLLPPASSGLQLPPHTHTIRIPGPFQLSLHPTTPLPYLDVNYSLTGNPTGPTIFIMPSMSHSALVTRPRHLRTAGRAVGPAGWWEGVVGWSSDYGIDLNIFQVLCASALGAPFGTSSPLSYSASTSTDQPPAAYRSSFPRITPLDQANAHHALLQHLIAHPHLLPSPPPHQHNKLTLPLHAIIGSSMGGMSTLQFATRFPTLFHRAVLICSTPLTSPSTQALRSIQRSAIRLDPSYRSGSYDVPPLDGMRLARKLGTICYRSRGEMDRRFDGKVRSDGTWQVEGYLEHVSWAFASRYDANCYLLLSECMDRMDIGQSIELEQQQQQPAREAGEVWLSADAPVDSSSDTYHRACERIASGNSEWLIFPITEDALIPAEESDRFAAVLGSVGALVHHERINSVYGHDAFLKEDDVLNPRLRAFLGADGDLHKSGVESVRRYVDELNKL